MRLIDKDEILNLIGAIVSKFPEEYDEKTYKMIRRVIRDKRQEVKSIPIEWIWKWYDEETHRLGDGWTHVEHPYSMKRMIEDWEKENE